MSCRKEGGKWSAPAAPPAFQFREIVSYSEAAEGGREPHLSSRSKLEREAMAPDFSALLCLISLRSRHVARAVSQCAASLLSLSLLPLSFLGRLEQGCPRCRSWINSFEYTGQVLRIIDVR
ncbi:hypothetical protein An09g04160 [Aspergillus niger]|uniref:Uncharacterized protein n=2 Tax=Aspergillus niger TaxID=5061 RepID=A2QU30_ASPNC|nr:hypothetical protein An09g04160 [Aspergillus niger]CAK96858.1 hypothetical protein An09g04160 [Aspergillus niger]